MKRYARLLRYFKPFKANILLYITFTLLSIVFGIVSLSMLIPFLDVLFDPAKRISELPVLEFNASSLLNTISYYLSNIISKYGVVTALGYICIIIVISVFLKNLFLYLSFYVLSPMRNSVMTSLRNDLYNKILSLPIGYFTEQRKGDLISRMTNDTWELEGTVVNTMEGLVKEPLNIIIILGTLVFLSPQLSIFLLIFLPITGFVIGRVSRSLKKQSSAAAIKLGEGLSILDETLTGLRVIKAFNAEHLLTKKFYDTNDALYLVKNKMNYRRDLASPMSEFLGVLVLCGILWFGGRLVLGNDGFALKP
ncbi:MAG: ABC transporter transmembrane domain-containing protein, partial [Chitinophagaceae bacterium]